MLPQRDPEGHETRHLLKLANFTDQRVLEIGCGDGRLTWRYAEMTQRVIGIDPDPIRLAAASEHCPEALQPRVALVRGTAEAIPFSSQAFDVALLAWSL
jgi:ubiquinone/menaquinone biosynthesis C-methylase UbiE